MEKMDVPIDEKVLRETETKRLLECYEKSGRNDPEIRKKIVELNMPFVPWYLHRKMGKMISQVMLEGHLEFEDILQESYLCLIQAVDSYDKKHGATFGTYAGLKIHNHLYRYLQEKTLIRRPPQVVFDQKLLCRLEHEYFLETNRKIPLDILVDRSGLSKSRIDYLSTIPTSVLSCDKTISVDSTDGLEEGTRILDLFESNDAPVDAHLDQVEMREVANLMLGKLEPMARDIVVSRTCLDQPEPLSKIGQRYGMTRQQVDFRYKQAMKRLRTRKNYQLASSFVKTVRKK